MNIINLKLKFILLIVLIIDNFNRNFIRFFEIQINKNCYFYFSKSIYF